MHTEGTDWRIVHTEGTDWRIVHTEGTDWRIRAHRRYRLEDTCTQKVQTGG